MKGLLSILTTALLAVASANPIPANGDVAADDRSPVLFAREFSSSTQNDLASGSPCKKVSLIFARGTSETGNMGSVVGPPLATNLASSIGSGNLAVQGVEYAASASGAASGGDTAGAKKMAQLANDVVKKCPDTQVVLAGYSQGAQLVHKAGAQLDSATATAVKAVTVFGDPYNGQAIQNIDAAKVKTFCRDVSKDASVLGLAWKLTKRINREIQCAKASSSSHKRTCSMDQTHLRQPHSLRAKYLCKLPFGTNNWRLTLLTTMSRAEFNIPHSFIWDGRSSV